MAGPLRSSRSPLEPLSLAVMMAALKIRFSGTSTVMTSPFLTWPGFSTFAKTPSTGMMQLPTSLRISQAVWHSFPNWVICRTASPTKNFVPMGSERKSMPSTSRFSPKSPGRTWTPFSAFSALNCSSLSKERRLTWRCQLPAWASFAMPSGVMSLSMTSRLTVPLRSEMQTALTIPSIYGQPPMRDMSRVSISCFSA